MQHSVGSLSTLLPPSMLRKADTDKDFLHLPHQANHHDHTSEQTGESTSDGSPRRLLTKRNPQSHSNAHKRDKSKGGESDRHFTIANVGSHGTIYLRPSVPEKESNQHPVPPPVFSLSPHRPSTSGRPLTSYKDKDPSGQWHDGLHESAAAATIAAHFEQYASSEDVFAPGQYYAPPEKHQSSAAGSPERLLLQTQQRQQSDVDLLSPVIARRDSQSSRKDSAHENDDDGLLRIPIPNYRIGNPQFRESGTAYISTRSIYTVSSTQDDRGSGDFSHLKLDELFPSPPLSSPPVKPLLVTKSSPIPNEKPSPPVLSVEKPSPEVIHPPPSISPHANLTISPTVYDPFVQDSENVKYIRYLPNGHILAATPARLIAQVTHAQLLDYELLSDFFLTFRAFVTPAVLLRYLVARLRWAVFRGGQGRIVRVRTFVAMRHWILNYFMDDFEPDFDLRLLFCVLVNELAKDLYARPDKGGGDLQVVGELKKCWRRTCDVVWSATDSAPDVTAIHDIVPHGESRAIEKYVPMTSAGPTPTGEKPLPYRPVDKLFRKNTKNKHQRLACFDPAGVTTLVLGKGSPGDIRLRQDSFDVTSCSIPMWRHLERAAPSFKPRTLMPLSESQYLDVRIEQDAETEQERRTGRSASDGTDALPQFLLPRKPVPKDLRRFRSGDLIRGLLVPPPTPTVRKQFATGAFVANTVRIEGGSGGQTSKPPSRIASQMKRKLSTRNHNTKNERSEHDRIMSFDSQDRMDSPLQLRPDTAAGTQAMVPIKYVTLSRSDRLAARASEVYEQLSHDRYQADPEPPRPPSRHGMPDNQALGFKTHDRSRSRDLPIGYIDLKSNSKHLTHMTTGSQSIFIVDDTGDRNSPFTEADLHDRLIPRQRFHPTSGYFAIQPEATPDHQYSTHHAEQAVPGAHVTDEIPPLPTMPETSPYEVKHTPRISGRASSVDLLPRSLGVLPDEDDELTERGTIRGSSEIGPLDADALDTARPHMLRRKPGGPFKGSGKSSELIVPRRNSTGTITSYSRSRRTSATLSTEIADAQVASVLGQPRLIGHSPGGDIATRVRRSLSLLSTHSSQPNLRESFEAEVQRLRKLEIEALDDGGIDATLARLEGRQPSNPNSPVAMTSAAAKRQNLSVLARPHQTRSVKVVGHPDHPQTSKLDLATPDEERRPAPSVAQSASASRSRAKTPHSALSSHANVEDEHSQSTSSLNTTSADASGLHVYSPIPRRSESIKRNWPLVSSEGSSIKHASIDRVPSTTGTQQSFLLEADDDEFPGHMDDNKPADRLHTVTRDVKTPNTLTTAPSSAERSFFFEDDDAEDDLQASNQTLPSTPPKDLTTPQGFEPPTSPPPSTPLPALPLVAPLHDPIPEKAAQRLRTPGPHAMHEAAKSAISFPKPQPLPRNHIHSTSEPLLNKTTASGKVNKNNRELMKAVPPLPDSAAGKTDVATHTPFILAFSSESLALQFTVIEKNALAEIDWKELIDLKWAANPPKVHNWADYCMRTPNQSGVDIVIARFNLVVKWAISEILMCNSITDRGKTISKFIHIAAHCRRLGNYATMYQLTVALLSTALARLTSTWTLVAESERTLLSELEEIVQPVKNFARLRREMETSFISPPSKLASRDNNKHARSLSKGAQDGYSACIPFLGIYTHDLAYNAQRPAFLAPAADKDNSNTHSPLNVHPLPPSTSASYPTVSTAAHRNASNASVLTVPPAKATPQDEQMIHFDRFQRTAAIVKGLLRLLEASSRYTIVPERDLAGRCLWLAALSDEEIDTLSRRLE